MTFINLRKIVILLAPLAAVFPVSPKDLRSL